MTPMVIGSAAHSGTPRSICPTSVRAANNTMMPCEKLKTPEALKMSTKPSATMEYMTPDMSPPSTTRRRTRRRHDVRNRRYEPGVEKTM